VDIYIADIGPCADDMVRLCQMLPPESAARCRRFRKESDSLRTLAGELLVRYAISTRLSVGNDRIRLARDANGKPVALGLPIELSISHSGSYAVCAVAAERVGIDIQELRPVDLKIARRQFTAPEYDMIAKRPQQDQANAFFDLWTLKESYIKWDGRGLAIPLSSFSFRFNGDAVTLDAPELRVTPFLHRYSVPGYKCAVCGSVGNFPPSLRRIRLADINLAPYPGSLFSP